MEDFRRPDHPDFLDMIELQKLRWSGIRLNSISHYFEIWIDGVRKAEMPEDEVSSNPQKWEQLLADVFALKNVEVISTKGN